MHTQEKHIKILLDATGLFRIITKIEVYKNVILAYDPDLDERLKEVIEIVIPYFRNNLQVVHECDGTLTMIWKNEVPECFMPGESIDVTYSDGQLDFWHIGYSTSSQKITQNYKNRRLEQLQFSMN